MKPKPIQAYQCPETGKIFLDQAEAEEFAKKARKIRLSKEKKEEEQRVFDEQRKFPCNNAETVSEAFEMCREKALEYWGVDFKYTVLRKNERGYWVNNKAGDCGLLFEIYIELSDKKAYKALCRKIGKSVDQNPTYVIFELFWGFEIKSGSRWDDSECTVKLGFKYFPKIFDKYIIYRRQVGSRVDHKRIENRFVAEYAKSVSRACPYQRYLLTLFSELNKIIDSLQEKLFKVEGEIQKDVRERWLKSNTRPSVDPELREMFGDG
jgi:hypothetical protein